MQRNAGRERLARADPRDAFILDLDSTGPMDNASIENSIGRDGVLVGPLHVVRVTLRR
jgi:hypothetical protein